MRPVLQVLSLAAAENAWEHRQKALFFSGANLGFPRRNMSLTNWSEVEEVCMSLAIHVHLALAAYE